MGDDKPSSGDVTGGLEALGSDLISGLQFGPSWARQSPGTADYQGFSGERESRRDRGPGRGRPDRNRMPGPRRDDSRRDRPSRDRREAPSRPGAPSSSPPRERDRSNGPRHAPDLGPRLPVRVNFIPEQKRLSEVCRQIINSRQAYSLQELVRGFLSDSEACSVKIEVEERNPDFHLYQCKTCKMVSADRAVMLNHMVHAHLDEYFVREEVEREAPSGQFTCVARCGLSGTLLGPPNHHSYAEKVDEVHSLLYPQMSADEYRRKIQTVHDPELIEKWKQECCRQTTYRIKESAEGATPMRRNQAHAWFLDRIAPGLLRETPRAVLPVLVALKMEDRDLFRVLQGASRRESRSPRSLLYSLRPALRHRELHMFRLNNGEQEFVSSVKPCPLDPALVAPPVRAVLSFVREHPRASRESVVQGLAGGESPAVPASEVMSTLRWLAEKGHVVEFSDATFSVPPSTLAVTEPTVAETVPPNGTDPEAAPASEPLNPVVADGLPPATGA